jgi:hypothetical protein
MIGMIRDVLATFMCVAALGMSTTLAQQPIRIVAFRG